MSPEQQWNDAMGDLRSHLSDIRQALDEGDLDRIAPFAVPSGLPGMPLACVDEARSLVDDQNELEAEVRRVMDSQQPSLARSSQPQLAFRRSRFEARA
ncbi:MAG: hypothetical protein AB8G14_10260 [Ilumatobacter sp.]